MTPSRVVALALVLASLAAPVGTSGTRSEPDIVDARGEVTARVAGPTVNVATRAIDLLSVWIDPRQDALVAGWSLAGLGERPSWFDAAVYSITFENDEYAFALLQARYDRGTWTFFFLGEGRDGHLAYVSLDGWVDEDAGVIETALPRSHVSSALRDVVASTLLAATTNDSTRGGGVVWFRDVAPDHGLGVTIPLG